MASFIHFRCAQYFLPFRLVFRSAIRRVTGRCFRSISAVFRPSPPAAIWTTTPLSSGAARSSAPAATGVGKNFCQRPAVSSNLRVEALLETYCACLHDPALRVCNSRRVILDVDRTRRSSGGGDEALQIMRKAASSCSLRATLHDKNTPVAIARTCTVSMIPSTNGQVAMAVAGMEPIERRAHPSVPDRTCWAALGQPVLHVNWQQRYLVVAVLKETRRHRFRPVAVASGSYCNLDHAGNSSIRAAWQ